MDKQWGDLKDCAMAVTTIRATVLGLVIYSSFGGESAGEYFMDMIIINLILWLSFASSSRTRAILSELRLLRDVLGEQGKKDEH